MRTAAFEVVGRLASDLAVDDAVHVGPVAPQERKVEDLQLRRDAAPDGGARDHEVDEPFLELLHDLALLAERAARKEPDRDGAAGGRLRRWRNFSAKTCSAVVPAAIECDRRSTRRPRSDRERQPPPVPPRRSR